MGDIYQFFETALKSENNKSQCCETSFKKLRILLGSLCQTRNVVI